MSVPLKTPYGNERSTMISMANILVGDLRRQAQKERLANKVERPNRVIHVGPYRIKVERPENRAA